MTKRILEQSFEALIQKYAELLTGETTPEIIEKVKMMALYSYISKAMPPLINHWNQNHLLAKEEMKEIFEEIKRLNEVLKQSRQSKE